jgi:N-acyl homoserine lactone hydrolase
MFSPQSIRLKTKGRSLNIHLFSTGTVAVKTRFREIRRKGWLSTLDFVLDRRFTDWLPIWVMVIEHPEGNFIVDTGECAAVNDPGYFRSSGRLASWFDKTQFRFAVSREEEVDRQLAGLHLAPADIGTVVLTHLHFDHTDGLRYFPTAKVIVNRLEWERPFGDLPDLYPPWFKPTLVETDQSYGAFPEVHPLTAAKDLFLVHTPGHTYGHCSVLILTDTCPILFAADICYSQDQLLEEKFAANSASLQSARQTYTMVKAFALECPILFLPSHDGLAGIRLKELQLLNPFF